MKIVVNFDALAPFVKDKKTAVTIGKFEAMHLGHKKIISTLLDVAKNKNECSVVVTYDTFTPTIENYNAKKFSAAFPESVEREQALLLMSDKMQLLEKMGVDFVVLLHPNEKFFETKAVDFVQNFLIDKLNAADIIVGSSAKMGCDSVLVKDLVSAFDGMIDFHFLEELSMGKELGVDLSAASLDKKDGSQTISSTLIKKYLSDGDVKSVNSLLGYNYKISGVVYRGIQKSSMLGFPTANLGEIRSILPKVGLYAGYAHHDGKKYKALCYIYLSQSDEKYDSFLTEVHFIADKELDLYWQNISFEFIDYIREPRKFASFDDLSKQIKLDVEQAENLL